MENYMNMIQETAKFISSKLGKTPDVAIILGSGLGGLVDQVKDAVEINYSDIPNFPKTTIVGHAGKLVVGTLGGKYILAMKGRFHYYEGNDISTVVFPIRVFQKLGIKNLLVTNAAGGINRNYNAGDLMLISDHIGLFAPSALRGSNIEDFGPRFPDMSEIYSKELIEVAEKSAKEIGIIVRKGVYLFTQGPNYETPSEIRFAEKSGADAVGMSTVPETVVARHGGMRTLGISCITNMAAGILNQPLSHEEVFETAEKTGMDFKRYIVKILENWK